MPRLLSKRLTLSALAVGVAVPLVVSVPAQAVVTRTSGTGQYVNVSWTESDPDDLLGLPGNVHVGYLYAEAGPYGTYFYGNVTDFDCDEGEVPWGGHGVVVDEGADAVADAVADTVGEIVDGGGSAIDPAVVIDAVTTELSEEVLSIVEEDFEEIPSCDYIQDRFLEGDETTKLSVNTRTEVARITGRLTVTSGGHGEPGNVLGTPPVDVTITGGDWQRFEYSSKVRGENYSYKYWQKGTGFDGGVVTGGIGAMGFADDADDVSYGGFAKYRYETVDRLR